MFDVDEIEVDVMIEVEQEPFTPPAAVPVIHGANLRSGTPLVMGMMPFGALLPLYEIPHYNYTTKEGYQRLPQMSRVSQFASEIRRGRVDFPTAVLLNLRSSTAAKAVADGMLRLERLG